MKVTEYKKYGIDNKTDHTFKLMFGMISPLDESGI